MALFRSGGGRSLPAGKVKAAIGILFLTGLWLAIAQYSSKCPLWRPSDPSSSYIVPANDAGVSHDAAIEQANSVELTDLLKEAMQHGQVGKPTVHLVEAMSAMKHPFLMFVCSNCFCDICDKVRLLGYWSPVESHIFHHVLRKYGCRDGKALVIDVGAHVGWFSLVSASYGCRVVSFEPNTVALRYLNLSRVINNLHHQVALYPKGVGLADSQAEYRQTDTWALNGFVTKKRRSLLETVEVARLDTVVDEDVLLLKIDTEGYEANVFAGAKNLLSRQKIQNILAEVKAASSPGKRTLLHSIFTTGGFTKVYNWDEVITPLSVPFEQFGLQSATIVDVTEIVKNPNSYAQLQFQDFWFSKEVELPWL